MKILKSLNLSENKIIVCAYWTSDEDEQKCRQEFRYFQEDDSLLDNHIARKKRHNFAELLSIGHLEAAAPEDPEDIKTKIV